jgi:hypothetical protein
MCCKLDSTLCIETSKELRTRLAEVVYVEYADQSLTKQLVTCSMDTAYPPIRNNMKSLLLFFSRPINLSYPLSNRLLVLRLRYKKLIIKRPGNCC